MQLQLVHAVGSTVYFVFFILFLCSSRVPRTNAGSGWWALAILSAFVSRLAIWLFSVNTESEIGVVVYSFFVIAEKLFLMIGVSRFFGKLMQDRWLVLCAALAQCWAIAQWIFGMELWVYQAGLIAFNFASLSFVVAAVFLSTVRVTPLIDRLILWTSALLALHWLLFIPIYLFVYPAWRVDAFVLGTILVTFQYLSLLIAVFTLFHRRLMESEAHALEMAYQDPLTGLSNKRYIDVLFEQVVKLANRPHQTLAVYYIDLDKFKPINDKWGHKAGDLVLKEVANRMKDCLRSTDICARIGGDEFIVIATQLEAPHHAKEIAEKLLKQLQLPIQIGKDQCELGASIGVSLYPDHGQEVGELIDKADKAMYQVKTSGKNGYLFFGEGHEDNCRD